VRSMTPTAPGRCVEHAAPTCNRRSIFHSHRGGGAGGSHRGDAAPSYRAVVIATPRAQSGGVLVEREHATAQMEHRRARRGAARARVRSDLGAVAWQRANSWSI
jgi:hypothetical protein